ncbi:MAG: hypothetical protein D0433_11550 [Candidatus Thermochlorobacter aerophilum]|jgi:hypothetical protein|uniref:Uncharacterized protein n=1 Tax=Candidatus Thermochlorobacter aerophilus TaxID=1868324 RepID=A0A395LZ41_9BACT|nr:MAG: hypothetical protein D0433_11550 [Candidatus Thermochlorobacter aerophilum]
MEHDTELLKLIGEILLEKQASLRSKMVDNTHVQADAFNLAFAEEIIALAKNRLSVLRNEQRKDENLWLERSEEQYPHIRLHGGVREDDPPQ